MAGNKNAFQIDRNLLGMARHRASARPEGKEGFFHAFAGQDLLQRLAAVERDYAVAVDLGSDDAALLEALAANPAIDQLFAMDSLLGGEGAAVYDDECLPLGSQCCNLVTSCLQLHWVNDLPGTLIQIRRVLAPDGLFLANIIGAGSLFELAECFLNAESELTDRVHQRVMPFATVQDVGALLQRAGFSLPVVDIDPVVIRYSDPLKLMRELRAMGAVNVAAGRSRQTLRQDVLKRVCELYQSRFSDPDGKVRVTVNLISISAWAPHESQQKPLRPGSAKMRLADALGVDELRLPTEPQT